MPNLSNYWEPGVDGVWIYGLKGIRGWKGNAGCVPCGAINEVHIDNPSRGRAMRLVVGDADIKSLLLPVTAWVALS